MTSFDITTVVRPAKAPPHQKVGTNYLYRLTAARTRATPRRAFVRSLLTDIASKAWYGDITWEEYRAKKETLSKGYYSKPARAVQAKLPGRYPDDLQRQTVAAFMAKRKDKHAAAAGRKMALERIAARAIA